MITQFLNNWVTTVIDTVVPVDINLFIAVCHDRTKLVPVDRPAGTVRNCDDIGSARGLEDQRDLAKGGFPR